MTNLVQHYRRIPDNIEAGQVLEHTAKTLAKWCGGEMSVELDRGVDRYTVVSVPNIKGNLVAKINDFIVRKEDGRFYVMSFSEFAGEYEEVGKREEIRVADPKAPKTPHYVTRGIHPFG
jgi:hypothetical protein